MRGLIWEDARGEARHDTLDAGLHGAVQHVVVDRQVVPEELHLVFHVSKEAADLGSEVDHVVGLVLVVDGLGLGAVPVRTHTTGPLSLWRPLNAQAGLTPTPQIAILGGQVDPSLAGHRLPLNDGLDTLANQPRATGDHDHGLRHFWTRVGPEMVAVAAQVFGEAKKILGLAETEQETR